jgi:acetoin utilization protein AcuB
MSQKERIESYMTLCPHAIGIEQSAKLAREMMRKYQIRHLPVQSGGKLVGIVSDRDIKFASGWVKSEEAELDIEDVYTPEPYTVAPETPLSDVLTVLVREQISCALVAVEGKVKGVFTTTDACRILAERLSKD